MQAAIAPRGDAQTWLTHFVGSGLDDEPLFRRDFSVARQRRHRSRPGGRERAQGPPQGAGQDPDAEGGREAAPGPGRDHHRDGGSSGRDCGVQLWGWRSLGIFADRRQRG